MKTSYTECPAPNLGINKEIIGDEGALADIIADFEAGSLAQLKAIEVGNIFKLGSRFTAAIGATYTDARGAQQPIVMGCYGIGPSRVMGTIAECLSDEKGLKWPSQVALFQAHLIALGRTPAELAQCDAVYEQLTRHGVTTLYDDRHQPRPGEKFSDADLIGIPHRVVVSPKTLAQGCVELKNRGADTAELMSTSKLVEQLIGA